MNILVTCNYGNYGSYKDVSMSFVHAQVKAYAELGQQVRVIVPIPWGKVYEGKRVGWPMIRKEFDGAEIYYVRYVTLSSFGNRIGWNHRAAEMAIRHYLPDILRDFSPDVIHAHTLGFDSKIGAWLKARLHCPLVVTTHGSDTSVPADMGKGAQLVKAASGADLIVGVTSTLTRRLEQCGIQVPLTVIHNGFRIENLQEAETRIPGRIIQVATLNFQKRVCRTIEAFSRLHEAHPKMTLVLIGTGESEKELKAQVDTLGIHDYVDFQGRRTNKDVFREMARSQFFCLPSFREGFAVSYVEAMANGCITIGSEGEGISDFIVHKKNGFLVKPDDVDAIVKVVEWCLAHPDEANTIAEQGKKDALKLTWEKNAQEYINLFQSLTER